MSKLATFRLEEDIWDAFLAATKEEGVSASSALVEFVKWYVAGNRIPKDEAIAPTDVIDNRIEEKLDERIRTLEDALYKRIETLEERLGELAA